MTRRRKKLTNCSFAFDRLEKISLICNAFSLRYRSSIKTTITLLWKKKRKGRNEWSQVLIILINRWFLLPFSEHVTCIFMILHFHYGISSHYYRINRPLCLILLNSLLLFVAVVVLMNGVDCCFKWRESDSPMINHTKFSRAKKNKTYDRIWLGVYRTCTFYEEKEHHHLLSHWM